MFKVLCGLLCILSLTNASSWSCNKGLAWTLPFYWYGGSQMVDTYSLSSCSLLQIQHALYNCKIVPSFEVCNATTTCPAGSVCGYGSYPPLCTVCNTTANHFSYEYANITVNNTEALLQKQFWNYMDFYEHIGVDLIYREEKWLWSPNGQSLLHDLVMLHRSTWGDDYDFDQFTSSTSAYTSFNDTHIVSKYSSTERMAFDTGDVDITGDSGVVYYSIPSPSSLPATTIPTNPTQATLTPPKLRPLKREGKSHRP